MTTMPATRPRNDPRRGKLAILAGIAAATVILAALALWNQSREMAPHYAPQLLFPNLESEVRDVAHVHLQSSKASIDVVFKPDKGWVVASHDDYPADFDALRQTVLGLAQLETIEPKTGRADWLHYIDLGAPPAGNGVLISLLNENGAVLSSIIIGKSEDIGDPSGATGLFVREPGTTQTWLVRSTFEPKTDVGDWLEKHVLDVDRSRIQEVDVEPSNGPSYSARRQMPTDDDFGLLNIPNGRDIAYAGAADGVGAAIVGFTFDDVRPAKDFDFSDQGHASRLITRTFDGLIVTVATVQQGQDYWATVAAEAEPRRLDAQKEAREISVRTTGWAYKLPQYKGQLFMTSLESLLKPLPSSQPNKPAQ
jgi:hypothetical protein